jgi:hypothetical protein
VLWRAVATAHRPEHEATGAWARPWPSRKITDGTTGAGKSSKPSDRLRMQFPRYTHADVVKAQYALLTEKLGIYQLHAVIGISYGAR